MQARIFHCVPFWAEGRLFGACAGLPLHGRAPEGGGASGPMSPAGMSDVQLQHYATLYMLQYATFGNEYKIYII